jgi:hypothetical protein
MSLIKKSEHAVSQYRCGVFCKKQLHRDSHPSRKTKPEFQTEAEEQQEEQYFMQGRQACFQD